MHLYAAYPLRNFWLRVYVGEGQLGGVAVTPFPDPPAGNPTITAGHFQYAYGLPTELLGKDLSIVATVLKTSPSSRASITAELWETVPARYLPPGSTVDPDKKRRLKQFEATGTFGTNGKAVLSLAIKIV